MHRRSLGGGGAQQGPGHVEKGPGLHRMPHTEPLVPVHHGRAAMPLFDDGSAEMDFAKELHALYYLSSVPPLLQKQPYLL